MGKRLDPRGLVDPRYVRKGERFVAYADRRPAERLFITVNRVAKDGSWADISVQTWAVMWTKRQPLPMPFAERRDWNWKDLNEQEVDHMRKQRETAIQVGPMAGT